MASAPRPLRRTTSRWQAGLGGAVVVGGLVGLGTLLHAPATGLAVTALLGIGLLGRGWHRVPAAYGVVLGGLLVAYAVLGRGFAYLGASPLFVGEAVLAAGLVAALLHGRARPLTRMGLVWVLVALMAWGAARSVPYLGVHGLDALRDAVVWGYGAFALIVASLVARRRTVRVVMSALGRLAPIVVAAMAASMLVASLAPGLVPTVPGTLVPLTGLKGGDVAVHLVGLLALATLGLGRRWRRGEDEPPKLDGSTWLLAFVWLVALATTLTVRAALVTVAVGGLVLAIARPRSRWWLVAYLAIAVGAVSYATDVSFTLGGSREVSVRSLTGAVVSIFDPVGDARYDGSRRWRLSWWGDIVDYAALGELRWTGKGYGVNLANDDGYQVTYDDSLRSPHNAHMTVLARSGLPGAALWLLFHVGLLAALVRAHVLRRREGRRLWADTNLWLTAYLIAFHVNASFDVYLEGPQGGIWFWCVVGFALAALRLQACDASTVDAAPEGASTGAPRVRP